MNSTTLRRSLPQRTGSTSWKRSVKVGGRFKALSLTFWVWIRPSFSWFSCQNLHTSQCPLCVWYFSDCSLSKQSVHNWLESFAYQFSIPLKTSKFCHLVVHIHKSSMNTQTEANHKFLRGRPYVWDLSHHPSFLSQHSRYCLPRCLRLSYRLGMPHSRAPVRHRRLWQLSTTGQQTYHRARREPCCCSPQRQPFAAPYLQGSLWPSKQTSRTAKVAHSLATLPRSIPLE